MKTVYIYILVIILIVVNCLLPTANSFSQTPGEWTWMHGNSNTVGVFGTQGVASPANTPPALYESCEWTDKNGNFWLFGGVINGFTASAALWKYDPNPSSPTYNQWTWMKGPSTPNQLGVYGIQGVPSPTNYPGSRGWGVASWVDALGNLWLFGGAGINGFGNPRNDLWKYDISTNEWTWMNGPNTANDPGSYGTQGVASPTNLPPSRSETSCTWADNAGNLWLYGGFNNNLSQMCGDLWKYDISTNEWTWMHGVSTGNAPAVYGIQGVAAPANTPGGRCVYSSWTDLAGNLWLFSGDSANDLWKYNISTNQWTWMKGSSTASNPGNYGIKCVSTNSNLPTLRGENRARVRDACGNFWNFGGVNPQALNDLWHYNVFTNQWTWVSGDNIPNQAAIYGIAGVSSPTNKPGAKEGSVAWMDNQGYIWVFGGKKIGVMYNDLFRYVPDPACVPVSAVVAASSNTTICIGQSATLSASGGTSYSWSPGGQSTSSIVVNPATSTTYTVTSSNACGSGSSSVTVTVNTSPTATVASTNVLCNGGNTGSAIVTASAGAVPYTYTWNTTPVQNTSNANGLIVGTYNVIVADSNGCTSTQSVMITEPSALVLGASTTQTSCNANTGTATANAAGGAGAFTYSWNPTNQTTPMATGLGTGNYVITVTDANGCTRTQIVTIGLAANSGELYLPNAFSPNNDGENDEFCLQGGMEDCIKKLKIIIYDRWGENIYESGDENFCWDGIYQGKLMNTAVCVYYLEATLISGKQVAKKGNISLIR